MLAYTGSRACKGNMVVLQQFIEKKRITDIIFTLPCNLFVSPNTSSNLPACFLETFTSTNHGKSGQASSCSSSSQRLQATQSRQPG